VGLEASHHTRIFLRGEENLFFLDIFFQRTSANACDVSYADFLGMDVYSCRRD
jgi:hypothetical protein